MPVIISQIKSSLNNNRDSVIKKALSNVSLNETDVKCSEIFKTSLDARKQNNIHFVHSIFVKLESIEAEKNLCKKYACCSFIESSGLSPVLSNKKKIGEIVIAGFGPAGMFAGLILAEYGYNPIIFERGEAVDDRVNSVNTFWNGGKLNSNSNVQFGEGGAGTFSDGKLTTRISDPLCRIVLEKFVEFGAPAEILYKAKPHIGTDNLRDVVKAIRERIIELGGKIYFNSTINKLEIKNNSLVEISSDNHSVKTQALILAIGHSARDTFQLLLNCGVHLENKAFSVGARIEHLQYDVNSSLYGKHFDNPLLPQGEYQLSHRDNNGRAVYTFCMCPGGVVVPSSSEHGGIVTNGMSEFSRNGNNANSALVVSVSKDDFGNEPLAGVDFARKIEHKAFIEAGSNYSAPCTSVGNLFKDTTKSCKSNLIPTYSRGVTECDFEKILPSQVTSLMKIGLTKFSRQMACFGDINAIITGPETRTSSPVRITRNENFESISTKNIFPCGEGAGYAGGIMSAAVDGIKVALKIMENFAP